MPRHGIGTENPINDKAQIVFALVFFFVWGIDSFILYITVNFIGLMSLLITLPVGVISFIMGVYLVRKSESVVFGQKEMKVIDSGVYGWIRHPMYLGLLLILLGFTIATLSILSFIVWVIFFIFLDRMASYEEKDLIRMIGQQYLEYQRKVHKWMPIKRTRN
jgi:protein-S-isoprenylcysteine O-methyltransferase Ste14